MIILTKKIATNLLFCLLLSSFSIIGVHAFGQKEQASSNQHIRIEGIVRLIGNEPFTSLVITDSNEQDWYINPDDQKELRNLQQRAVLVEGTLTVQKQILADGRELPDKKVLTNIKILKK